MKKINVIKKILKNHHPTCHIKSKVMVFASSNESILAKRASFNQFLNDF